MEHLERRGRITEVAFQESRRYLHAQRVGASSDLAGNVTPGKPILMIRPPAFEMFNHPPTRNIFGASEDDRNLGWSRLFQQPDNSPEGSRLLSIYWE
jgi:hypothetical protein